MTLLRDNLYAVEVPDDAKNFRFGKSEKLKGKIFYNTTLDYWAGAQLVDVGPGTWSIVCTSREATEEHLKEIIPEMLIGDRYPNYNGDYPVWFHSRRESLRSLLTSRGLDVNKSYLILKKEA